MKAYILVLAVVFGMGAAFVASSFFAPVAMAGDNKS